VTAWDLLICEVLLVIWWLARHHSYLPDHVKGTTPMANNRRPMQMPQRDDTFDAGQYGTLRYDFKKYGGVQGIIPDPSDEQIEEFMRSLRQVARDFGDDELEDVDVDNASAEELSALLDKDDSLELAAAQRAMCECYAQLCQGSPDAAALLSLPLRVRQGFMTWLQRKLLSGEASAADTSGSQARRTGG
jgi:hypothetical protein